MQNMELQDLVRRKKLAKKRNVFDREDAKEIYRYIPSKKA